MLNTGVERVGMQSSNPKEILLTVHREGNNCEFQTYYYAVCYLLPMVQHACNYSGIKSRTFKLGCLYDKCNSGCSFKVKNLKGHEHIKVSSV